MPCLTQGIFSNTSTTISSRWNWTITKQRVSLFVAPEFPETETRDFNLTFLHFFLLAFRCERRKTSFFPKDHFLLRGIRKKNNLDGADPENLDVFFGFFCVALIILRLMQACPLMTTQTLSPWLTPKATLTIGWMTGHDQPNLVVMNEKSGSFFLCPAFVFFWSDWPDITSFMPDIFGKFQLGIFLAFLLCFDVTRFWNRSCADSADLNLLNIKRFVSPISLICLYVSFWHAISSILSNWFYSVYSSRFSDSKIYSKYCLRSVHLSIILSVFLVLFDPKIPKTLLKYSRSPGGILSVLDEEVSMPKVRIPVEKPWCNVHAITPGRVAFTNITGLVSWRIRFWGPTSTWIPQKMRCSKDSLFQKRGLSMTLWDYYRMRVVPRLCYETANVAFFWFQLIQPFVSICRHMMVKWSF